MAKKVKKETVQPEVKETVVTKKVYTMKDMKYEFRGILPNRKMDYVLHEIVNKEWYTKIYDKMSELYNKYPKLLTIKLENNAQDIYGIAIFNITQELKKKWFIPNNIPMIMNDYEYELTYKIFRNHFELDFIPDNVYTHCEISNIYIDKFGELYFTVVRRNDGISIFNTLMLKTELINLRNEEKAFWMEKVYTCIEDLDNYLMSINYNEK